MTAALKCVLSVFLIVLSISIFSVNAFAQNSPTNGSNTSSGSNGTTGCTAFDPNNPNSINGQNITPCSYFDAQNTQNMGNNILSWVQCSAFGTDLTDPDPYHFCLQDTKTGLVAYRQLPGGGAMGGLANVMVALYSNPPINTTEYLADVGSNLGLVKPAYAKVSGAGNGVLYPILKVWQITRNIAYLAFILVFMIVGFMIMMRQKINAQTVVSVQNALPGLVLGLILVTFSYLIAALIVDSAFIGTSLVVSIVHSSGIYEPKTVFDPGQNNNILTVMKNLALNADNFKIITDPLQKTFSSIFSATILGGTGGSILGKILGAGLGGLATVIIGLAIIIQMFRLLFELVKAYVSILIITVLGPFIILGASVPGRSAALSGWWRPILANSLVFPAVIGAFLFAGIFLRATPDSSQFQALPLFGGVQTDLLRVVLGFSIIMITPAIPKHVKDALKAPDHPIGQHAIGGAVAGAELGGAVGGIAGRHAARHVVGRANEAIHGAAEGNAPRWALGVRAVGDRLYGGRNAQGHYVNDWYGKARDNRFGNTPGRAGGGTRV